jgi:hypothetical protein
MKKMFPLVIVAVTVLMLFAGVAGAVVMEEPIELEEGMMGITAIMDEPVEGEAIITAIGEDVVGRGIEGEVTITAVEGVVPEGGEEIYYTTGADELKRTSRPANYLPHAGIAAGLLLAAAFMAKRKKAVPVR